MSKAFTREDVDPPERSGRVRSSSGLPPGATNYISKRGARRLQQQLANARSAVESAERIAELERVLSSVTIVDPPDQPSAGIGFGSTVTLETAGGGIESYTIAGVDELGFEPDGVSWVSPVAKALFAAEVGQRLVVGGENLGRIIKVEYRAD